METDVFSYEMILAPALAALAALLLAWRLGVAATEITYVTLADGRRAIRNLPLLFKLVLPFAANIRAFNKPRYDAMRETVRRKLVSAGFDDIITPQEFMATKLLLPLAVGPVFILLMWFAFKSVPGGFGEFLQARQLIFFVLADKEIDHELAVTLTKCHRSDRTNIMNRGDIASISSTRGR